ncbi:ANTAR domain-containing protein [Agrobacterium sp. rho-8.1]|nr:hypothetical protein [Agrobacterium sp. rho-8.1]
MILKSETGWLAPRRQGHLGGGKLSTHPGWVSERLAQNGELSLDELRVELSGRGVVVPRSSVGLLLHRLGLSEARAFERTHLLVHGNPKPSSPDCDPMAWSPPGSSTGR